MSSSLEARSSVFRVTQVRNEHENLICMVSLMVFQGTVEFGVITSFAYKLEDNGGEIVVATTRCVTEISAASAVC